MIQIKKTILTLVALLAVTTGAWADETLLLTIESKDNTDFKNGGSKTFDDKVIVTFSSSVRNDGDGDGWYGSSVFSSLLTVTGTNGYTITSCKFYTAGGIAANGYTVEGESPSVYLSEWSVFTDANQSVNIGEPGVNKIEVYTAAPEPSGPEVAWDKAEKTGTFKMPGGNVTLEPEYYPQAALTAAPTAINDVPATTDGAIVKAGTVANIGNTETAQGTVMYYVSKTALDDAALLALAADQWTADVPTAEKLAQGEAYVYYYVRGNDSDTDEENFSDGDILAANALTVTIAAEPTYAVTFAEGTDPNEWKAEPNAGVTKGQTVTVTYTGSKKVIGVKAEKKAKPAGPITVTWNPSDIVPKSPSDHSFTKDGITITAATCDFEKLTFGGGGTFTTTLGNFTKIEISADFTGNVSGTGWSNDGWQSATWTGNAASVSFSGDIWGGGMTCDGGNLKIVFTIE